MTTSCTTMDTLVNYSTIKQKRKISRPNRIVQLQCDFCGKTNMNVKHHATASFPINYGSATNFCTLKNRNRNSRCFSNYCKWFTSFNLSRGLPHIVQREYALQLQPKINAYDKACHNCGAEEKDMEEETSTKLIAVPTGAYDDTYTPKLDALGYQMFCKDKNCLKQFVSYIRNTLPNTPYIMKHVKFVLPKVFHNFTQM